MNTSVIALGCIGVGLAYYMFSLKKQNEKQQVLTPKHDKPKERQRVNEALNESQSRHNIKKGMYHSPIGPIDKRYIRPIEKIH